MVEPFDSVGAEVRQAQVRTFDRPEVCLELARALAAGKIMNQRTLSMRDRISLPPAVPAGMANKAERTACAESLDAIRGHGGQAAALYFAHFAGMFEGPLAAGSTPTVGSAVRPPDSVKTCPSLGYTMLVQGCAATPPTRESGPDLHSGRMDGGEPPTHGGG
jgi:CRISPR/Cas system-associated endonuclease Cas1